MKQPFAWAHETKCVVCERPISEFPRGRGVLPDWVWLHEDDESELCEVPVGEQ